MARDIPVQLVLFPVSLMFALVVSCQPTEPCSTSENADGSVTLQCEGSEPVTLRSVDGQDGQQGADGQDGEDGQDGARGTDSLILVEDGAAMACPTGGDRIHAGQDRDRDGLLEEDEIDQSVDVCDGSEGPEGPAGEQGSDGRDVLVLVQPGVASSCAGGDRILFGHDDNGDGVLDFEEIEESVEICDGEEGRAGRDADSFVFGFSQAPRDECPHGGLEIKAGDDLDGDGILDPGEVDSMLTSFVCDEPPLRGHSIAAGDTHTCAVTQTGGLECWGENLNGKIGQPTSTSASLIPSPVTNASTGFIAVATAAQHNCALTNQGEVFCWGQGASGKLGNGTQTSSFEPVAVTGLNTAATQVVVGEAHSCALLDSGEVWCWGSNTNGQLGNNTVVGTSSTPVIVNGLGSNIVQIVAGNRHMCALTAADSVYCWGSNSRGQLGVPDTTGTLIPREIESFFATSLSAGNFHTCAIDRNGGAYCWGDNAFGQLGDGTKTDRGVPVAVDSLDTGVSSVWAGGGHTCAIMSLGGAKCWGNNASGQLGAGDTLERLTPADVVGLDLNAGSISAGESHTCAIESTNELQCWGDNQFGMVGDGTNHDTALPIGVYGG